MYEGAEAFFKETVDIFCNNAGINHTFGWRKCMDIDFVWKHGEKLLFHFICLQLAVMQATYLVMERMSKANGGKGSLIVNTASAAGIIFGSKEEALVEANSYLVAKHGVVALTRTLGVSFYLGVFISNP